MKKITVFLSGAILFVAMNLGAVANACTGAQGCENGTVLTPADRITSIVTFGANGAGGTGGYYLSNLSGATVTQKHIDWTNNFTFSPAAFSITNAVLTLAYHDVDLNNNKTEIAKFSENDFDLTTNKFTLNFSSGFSAFDNLEVSKNDTSLSFTLNAQKGDFYLDSATLLIDYKYCAGPQTPPGPAPVPEPGTMMLLGIGMLGLAVYGKRRMNKQA